MTREQQPRRRAHRRVIAPATNAGPEDGQDFTEPRLDDGTDEPEALKQEIGSDQWWHAQRPPHWE